VAAGACRGSIAAGQVGSKHGARPLAGRQLLLSVLLLLLLAVFTHVLITTIALVGIPLLILRLS
jgi:hypothetical protein